MFNIGIVKKGQLTPGNLVGFLNSRKFIAIDLYNCLDDLPQAQIDEIQERMLRRFRLQNGVLKCTQARRFDDFDQLSLPVITAAFSTEQPIRVHDIGASDGRASCGLFDHLNHLYGERLNFSASDYAPYLYVLRRMQSARRIVIDDQHQVLQIIMPPFVFIVFRAKSIKFAPLYDLVRIIVSSLYARPLVEDYRAGHPAVERTRLELVCRECRAYISERNNFHFDRYDVLSGPTECFDVIRAMNVLNFTYFSKTQLRRALQNIVESLSEGGLLITGSNTERGTIVDGGIYKKMKNHMEMVEISGSGSKVDALISDIVGCTDYGKTKWPIQC
jgi:hypothetical protein